jgi:hypothetical protein
MRNINHETMRFEISTADDENSDCDFLGHDTVRFG